MPIGSLSDTLRLDNGVEIPCVGFGTYKAPEGEVAYYAVREALDVGYRHIDTASYYGNEKSVGEAIRASGIPRPELFVTSKLWNEDHGYDRTMRAFDRTLDALGLEQLDLYLIHWPRPKAVRGIWLNKVLDTWRAMQDLMLQGRVRAIGVSNFWKRHLEEVYERMEIKPMVDQIEIHPGFPQEETVAWCQQKQIVVEAWSPLGRGSLLDHPILVDLAGRYGRTVAQICLRWALQRGIIPLPKSVTPARIASNAQLFDFVLSTEDLLAIDAIPPTAWSGLDPDTCEF